MIYTIKISGIYYILIEYKEYKYNYIDYKELWYLFVNSLLIAKNVTPVNSNPHISTAQ